MSQLLVLNHAPCLQAIVLKLPQHLQSKWRDRVTPIRMNGECFNRFKDLVDFIEFAAKSTNEPTFGKQALIASQNLLQPKSNSSSKGKQCSSRSQSANFVTQVGNSPDGKVNSPKCFYCKQFHDLDECKHFKQKSLVEKRDFLKNRCFSCYGLGHSAKGCMRKRICKTCNKRHPTAMRDNGYQSNRNASHKVNSDKGNEQSDKGLNNSTSCNASKSNCIETIFQPILPVQVTVKGSNKVTTTNAMLDNGSTGCFMTEDLRNRLDVKSKPATLKLQTMNGTEHVNISVVNGLVVSDLDGTNYVSLPGTYSKEVMPVDHAHIPKTKLLKQIPHLRAVADKLPTYMPNLDIGILIGSNCPEALKPLEVVSSNDSGHFAVLHKHGWTINGPMEVRQNIVDNTVVCNRIILHEVEKLRECIAPETVLKLFELDFSENDLDSTPDARGYSIEDQQFMEKTENSIQHQILIDSLIGVLTRFRSESVAFMGDVEAMFHQVKVPKEQQDFLRFFWWPNGNIQGELKEFRMTVHTFGIISSPTIANYALRELANKAKNRYDNDIIQTILRNVYVDDCLKSVKDDQTAVKLISDLQSVCAESGFNLTKFTCNTKEVLSSIPSEHCSKEVQTIDLRYDDIPMERALGMQWDVMMDSFRFSVNLPHKPPTRRGILSTMSSLYDPLGLVSPILLPVKRILQDLCSDKSLGWDDVDDGHKLRWEQWLSDMEYLKEYRIVRFVQQTHYKAELASLVSSCDEAEYTLVSLEAIRFILDLGQKVSFATEEEGSILNYDQHFVCQMTLCSIQTGLRDEGIALVVEDLIKTNPSDKELTTRINMIVSESEERRKKMSKSAKSNQKETKFLYLWQRQIQKTILKSMTMLMQGHDFGIHLDNNRLSIKEVEQFKQVLYEESDAFSRNEDDIGYATNLNLEIRLTGQDPVQLNNISIPLPLYKEMKEYINDLVQKNFIRKSRSPYSSAMV
ncbi:uncharacterized protein [Haliotis asinina]|uniref:uncharacterized protein n=1 Tax=Haliotis asinina TaxID=109174 RepID=UPI003531DE57